MVSLVLVITFLVGSLGPVFALDVPTYGVEELEPGMKGYGLTVYKGQKIEAFRVEILGVLENVMPDQDIILIKASGPLVNKTNIMAGMSGSPIYINDHLIGALAYSWPFEKEPVAGVTPVRDLVNAHREGQAGANGAEIKEITTPLVASGFAASSLDSLRRKLNKRGSRTEVITGGNSGGDLSGRQKKSLKPGSAVGVQLVRGDLNLAAVGTVTAVDSATGRVYAFGHPFLNGGRLNFPMTAAKVQTYLPSLRDSFKLASPLNPVGAIVEDRQAGIVGRLGESPEMLPVEIELESINEDFQKKYHVEIVRNKQLTPRFLNLVASSFTTRKLNQLGVNLVRTNIELDIADKPDLNLTKLYSSTSAYDPWSFLPVAALWDNPHSTLRVQKARLKISLFSGRREARITDFWTEPSVARRGGELTAYVTVDPYRKPEFTEKFQFSLSGDLQGDKLKLFALPAIKLLKAKPDPANLVQMIDYLNDLRLQNQLAIVLQSSGLNFHIAGKKVEDVPLSFVSPLVGRATEQLAIQPRMQKKIRELNWLLTGDQSLVLPLKSQ